MGGSAGVGAGISGNGLAHVSSISGAGAAGTSTTGSTAACGGANAGGSGYEVDEEGFSIQPAKEIAWEEGHDKCRQNAFI